MSLFVPSLTDVESGPGRNASQDETRVDHHVEAVGQPVGVCSPALARSPLLRQRRLMCFEDELSKEEDGEQARNTGLPHRPTKVDPPNRSGGFPASQAPPPLDLNGNREEGDVHKGGSHDDGSFPQCEEGIALESESPEVPLIPIRKPGGASALVINSENHPHQEDGQLESKRSPKLEHKAVTRVKSMMSIEAPNLPQQQKAKAEDPSPGLGLPPSQATQCGRNPKAAGDSVPHQPCKRGDASELVGVCTIDSVTLRRSEDESFGLDLEITSSPLKVVIVALRPGGAAERVRVTG